MPNRKFQILVFLAALTVTGWAHERVPHAPRASQGEEFVPTPRVAQQMAFGFEAVMADYHWLQAVQVVGGDMVVGAVEASRLGRLIDVTTTLNPHVGHPYRFAAVWLTHDDSQIREGIRLLERAIEYHPDDWRNYFYAGFNYFYYLGDYAAAATVIERAIPLPGRPAYLSRLVARLKSEYADIDVAEVFLREMWRNTTDEDEKTKLTIALDEIEIEYRARHLDRARVAYQERTGRDIESVEDLIRGPYRVLEQLPNAEPSSLPLSLSRDSVWEIDERSGEIVSSYLGARYEVHGKTGEFATQEDELETQADAHNETRSAESMEQKELDGNG